MVIIDLLSFTKVLHFENPSLCGSPNDYKKKKRKEGYLGGNQLVKFFNETYHCWQNIKLVATNLNLSIVLP